MSTQNDMLRQLLEQMKELNCKQDAALSAINKLTTKRDDGRKPEAKKTTPAPITHKHGYVNWNSTNNYLESQHWLIASNVTELCGSIERGGYTLVLLKNFTNMEITKVVNLKTRFPMEKYNAPLYLNVSSPDVWMALLQLQEKGGYKKERGVGIFENFCNQFKHEMHTRYSFEEKYGLIWVEIPKV